MNKKTILCLLTVLLLAAVSTAVIIIQKQTSGPGAVAKIYQDGQCIRTIDLSQVREPWEFTITGENNASNTIRVEPGRIAIISASCPDGICVRTGYISDDTTPITCLPNKIIIRIEGGTQSGIDGLSM